MRHCSCLATIEVVRKAPPDQILEALTGVALSPADLQAVLTGCAVPIATPVAGRLHQSGWASIDLDSGAMVYLEREGAQWRLRAGRHREWQIDYPSWQGAFPGAVRLISLRPGVDVDLTAAVSQLETNVQIDEAAFTVDVPPGASELRPRGASPGRAAAELNRHVSQKVKGQKVKSRPGSVCLLPFDLCLRGAVEARSRCLY